MSRKRFIMSFSGGLCSWFAARRLVDRYGASRVVLLFADTRIEHDDLYRFVDDASHDLGVPVTRIADGRTPWDIFFEHRMMGNTRIDLCSRILKRELLYRWHEENCHRETDIICVGLSYGERKRWLPRREGRKWIPGFRARMSAQGWMVQAPAMAPPYTDKAGMLAAALERGLHPSDSYEDGFAHDNCGIAPFLECSSRGDRRFSAFYARPVRLGGASIESAYQAAKVLKDGTTGNSWRNAKGKRAVNAEQCAALYKSWWRSWLIEARLIKTLIDATGLSDMFGQPGHICQATVLWELRQEAIDKSRPWQARKAGLREPEDCGSSCNELECRIQ